MDFDWPARPTLTFSDDPGHRSLAADYEASEDLADKASDRLFAFWVVLGCVVYVTFFALGVWKLLEIFGVSL